MQLKEKIKSYSELEQENEQLRADLEYATEAIEAIKNGQIDAVVVKENDNHQLYTIKSADQSYRVFIENMNEGAITLNPDGVILYSNSRFALMLGMPLSKVIGSYFHEFVPEDERALFNLLLVEGWGSDTKGEHNLIASNGEICPFRLSLKTLDLSGGMALGMIVTNLSSEKENQALLKKRESQLSQVRKRTQQLHEGIEKKVRERTQDLLISRQHFKLLADNIPVKVWTAGSDGGVDYFNKRWYEFTGVSPEQCLGWAWKDLVHPDDLEPILYAWNKSIEHVTPFKFEYRLRGSDGEYVWHFRHALPFKNENDNSIAWFGISTDIHETRQAMEKKDEFISVVSHELKTPLTSVKAYIQLIQGYTKEPLPESVRLYINKAEEYVRKLEHIIKDLMEVSKIQAGKLEFNKVELDMLPLLNACIENARLLFPEYIFEFSSQYHQKVIGNYERLEQVIMNLINNAVKYAPASNKIILGFHEEGQHARVTVTDFGIGLTDDQREMIFERFYRVNSVKYFFAGLGMGLYISSEIVKAHKGRMGVVSKLNEGSTFYFDLPLTMNP